MIKQQELKNRLEELFRGFDVSITPERLESSRENDDKSVVDFRIALNGPGKEKITFLAETKEYSNIAQIATAIGKLNRYTQKNKNFPLIVVPYMGQVGADFCKSKEVSWLDLSGNAHVEARDVYIHVQGEPNKYKSPGRPSNIFAPKSSRVSRFLLIHPERFFRQKTISDKTDLNRGYVSKIVHRLEEANLILKEDSKITVKDPEVMLEAWRENYNFNDHDIIKGTVPSKSSQTALRKISDSFKKRSVQYAATGLGAAWLYTEYSNFRLCSFYLQEDPDPGLLDSISFTKTKRGHNLWLVIPKDKGVTCGNREVKGINCVHPIQLYLDLITGHPERSKDAARSVKEKLLNWENQ